MKQLGLPIPCVGAWVVRSDDPSRESFGRVDMLPDGNLAQVRVQWLSNRESEWVDIIKVRNGFSQGMSVLEVPSSRNSMSLGEGIVRGIRVIAGSEQLLIEFLESGKKAWLPWQNLRQVNSVAHRFLRDEERVSSDAERFRLRSLAWALKLWNENTGAMAKFDIDPLPHQIHLVHHILASGDINWLIADDVGLGKTIETGLLIAALRQRKQANRVLLITPAGLTKQWQEELFVKFGMGDFRIYGDDFTISEPRHWKMHDSVIGSIDRFKNKDNLDLLLQAEPWDLVIFDEAHRLSRRQYGMRYNSSQRFNLARELRNRTESMLLLTATPHQGQQDSFVALLELLYPSRKDELLTLDLNPEILEDMVFRNRKADVTDIEGNFIFLGKTTRALRVPLDKEAHEFDKSLQHYLTQGYQSSNNMGSAGRAIGFVMTIYRKLATSSIASIYAALIRRRKRLKKELPSVPDQQFDRGKALDELGSRYDGEIDESIALETPTEEFFSGELALLQKLIRLAKRLKSNDRKLALFLEKIIKPVLDQNPNEKILVFSEYRGTQDWLRDALDKQFGQNKTVMINGSMNLTERRRAIASFEDDAQFLLSTEAGGEGINLHQRCHILVNYDLPWNPMRLIQRIGRLYRYGQNKRVVVFNIHSPDTLDEKIIEILYERLEQVVADMAIVGEEYNDSMADDVLGQIADLVEVEEILQEAAADNIHRTTQRIDEALIKAKSAADKQSILFKHVAGFDVNEIQGNFRIGEAHLRSFVNGMFMQLGIEVQTTKHKEQVWEIKLPEKIMRATGTKRSRHTICFNRELSVDREDLIMMDADSWLLNYLFKEALSHKFQGKTASIAEMQGEQAIMTAVLRWQDTRGRRMRQEFVSVSLYDGSACAINHKVFSDWLLSPKTERKSDVMLDKRIQKKHLQLAVNEVSARLSVLSSKKLIPEDIQWIGGVNVLE
jgi:superfamily II DNA or RNA helicase